jgi:hypothetical protein
MRYNILPLLSTLLTTLTAMSYRVGMRDFFEPSIVASERPQTHALDRAATGIASEKRLGFQNKNSYENEIIFVTFARNNLEFWPADRLSHLVVFSSGK